MQTERIANKYKRAISRLSSKRRPVGMVNDDGKEDGKEDGKKPDYIHERAMLFEMARIRTRLVSEYR